MTHPADASDLIVFGASGFGREALDVVEAMQQSPACASHRVLGVVDDAPSPINLERLAARGIDWLGTFADVVPDSEVTSYLLGIGSPAVRRMLVGRLDELGWHSPHFRHPSVTFGARTELAEGSVVCAGAQVSTNVSFGRHVHVNPNATIGHDAVLEDFVSVNPAAVISGEVVIGEGTLVGAGAIVLQGIRVGRDVVLGAGCVVTRDVPDGVVVKGIPGVWR